MRTFFGIEFKRQNDKSKLPSFAAPVYDDGAVNVAAGGVYGTYIDLEGTIRNESDLVTKYRQLALQPEIDRAINEICNEAIIVEEGKKIVELILDDVPIDNNVKKLIMMEFDIILDIMNFQNNAYEIFKRWYIDGRTYHHVIIDRENPKEGIQELRYIDPRQIRKIREIKKEKDPKSGIMLSQEVDEYYIYNDQGLASTGRFEVQSQSEGVQIQKDSIIHNTSGLLDVRGQLVLSYLHAALRPMNQLRSIEDSTLIYHLSRAPERRIFYVDTGSMPHFRAKQYMEELINNYRTKLTYNAETGEVKDQSKTMSMLEDYWLQVREGGRGTKIETLSGGTQLSQLLETVQLFEDKLYHSLQVPISRLKPDTLYATGRSSQISMDEINFSKFIDRVRNRFSIMFIETLEKQLVLKNIIIPDEFDLIRNKIKFRFLKDNVFSELKDNEIMQERFAILNNMLPFIGKIYSWNWIRKNICKQTDEDIEEEDAFISMEMTNPQFMPPEEEGP